MMTRPSRWPPAAAGPLATLQRSHLSTRVGLARPPRLVCGTKVNICVQYTIKMPNLARMMNAIDKATLLNVRRFALTGGSAAGKPIRAIAARILFSLQRIVDGE